MGDQRRPTRRSSRCFRLVRARSGRSSISPSPAISGPTGFPTASGSCSSAASLVTATGCTFRISTVDRHAPSPPKASPSRPAPTRSLPMASGWRRSVRAAWPRCTRLTAATRGLSRGVSPGDSPTRWSPDGRVLYLFRQRPSSPRRSTSWTSRAGRRLSGKKSGPAIVAGVNGIGHFQVTPDGTAYAYNFWRTLSDLYVVHGVK